MFPKILCWHSEAECKIVNVVVAAMKALNLGWQLEQHALHTDLNGNYSTHPSGKNSICL